MTNWKSLLAAVALIFALPAAALAASFETFVSGTGADGNPCSRTSPCATFQQAHNQTNDGGIIIALDSADYGFFQISKSTTIVAEAVNALGYANVTAPGKTVRFKGLTFAVGYLNITDAAVVTIEHCTFTQGYGVLLQPTSGSTQVVVSDSTINAVVNGVYVLNSAGAGGSVTLNRVTINGGSSGVFVDAHSNANAISVQINDSSITNATNGVWAVSSGSAGLASIGVSNSNVSGNNYGILAQSGQSVVLLDRTKVQNSLQRALYTDSGGTIFSYGNNAINNNAQLGTSPTVIGLH